jgi:hypothetical protein
MLGNYVLEPLFKEFQEQGFEAPRISLAGNKASVHEQHCTYYLYLFCSM